MASLFDRMGKEKGGLEMAAFPNLIAEFLLDDGWAAGESDPSPQHTAKAKELVRARIGELQRLLEVL